MRSFRAHVMLGVACALSIAGAASCNVALELPEGVGVTCDTSGRCPEGRVCLATTRLCVAPNSACVQPVGDAFFPVANGNQCSVDGGAGVCRDGTCVNAVCGDGFVQADLGEQCDDGNSNDNDACGGCRRNVWSASIAFGVGEDARLPERASVPYLRSMTTSDRGLILGTAELRYESSPFGPNIDRYSGLGALLSLRGSAGIYSYLTGQGLGLLELEEMTEATRVQLGLVNGLANGPSGELVIAVNGVTLSNSALSNVPFILALSRDGDLSIVTGNGSACTSGPCGDGSLARFGSLKAPADLAFDRAGRLYFVDDKRLRRIDESGFLEPVAGGGACTAATLPCGDGDDAEIAGFIGPLWLTASAGGRIIVSDAGAHRLRIIDTEGVIRAYVGTGVSCELDVFPNCPASAPLRYPTASVVVGNTLWVVDCVDEPFAPDAGLIDRTTIGGAVIRMFTLDAADNPAAGRVVFGTVAPCTAQPCGDGQGATAATTGVIHDLALLPDGKLAVIDDASAIALDSLGLPIPSRVRVVDLANDRVAGLLGRTSTFIASTEIPATGSDATEERALTALADGDVLYATGQQIIRVAVATGTAQVIAGIPNVAGCSTSQPAQGDAETFPFCNIKALARHDARVYVVDTQRVFELDGGTVRHVFGTGDTCTAAQFCPDVPDGRLASLYNIAAVAADSEFLYVTDDVGNAIWRASLPSGPANRIAGNGTRGFFGDDGPASASLWRCPQGVAVAAPGVIDIADSDNCRVRRIASDEVSTLIDPGMCPSAAVVDASPCAGWDVAEVSWAPQKLARAGATLYVTTRPVLQIWRHDTGGLTRIVGTANGAGLARLNEDALADTVSFGQSKIAPLFSTRVGRDLSIAASPTGDLWFGHAITNSRYIRSVRDGRLATVAGNLDLAILGDFAATELATPRRSVVSDGRVLVVDSGFVREVDLAQRRVDTLYGAAEGDDPVPLGAARYAAVQDGVVATAVAGPDLLYMVTRGANLLALERGGDRRWRVRGVSAIVAPSGTVGSIDDMVYVEEDGAAPVIYATDPDRNVIYGIDPTAPGASITAVVVAGQLDAVGGVGDSADAVRALLDEPRGLAVSPGKRVYLADAGNRRVRRLRRDAAGVLVIEAVANVDDPRGLAFDRFGNLVVAAGATLQMVYAADPTTDGEPNKSSAQAMIFDAESTSQTSDGAIRCLNAVVSDASGSLLAFDECAGVALDVRRNLP